MARIKMTFREAGEQIFPQTVQDSGAVVFDKREISLAAAYEYFLDAYSIARQPYVVAKNVEKSLDSALALIESSKRIAAAQSDFARALLNAKDKVAQLIRQPEELVDLRVVVFDVREAVPQVVDDVVDPVLAVQLVEDLALRGLKAVVAQRDRVLHDQARTIRPQLIGDLQVSA